MTRAGWLTFTFDEECRLTDRSLQFGTLAQAADNLFLASLSQSRPIEIAAAVFCLPSIGPPDLRQVMSDVVALKCPRSVYSVLLPHERAIWTGTERKPGEW